MLGFEFIPRFYRRDFLRIADVKVVVLRFVRFIDLLHRAVTFQHDLIVDQQFQSIPI